jgi:hypothetical protein
VYCSFKFVLWRAIFQKRRTSGRGKNIMAQSGDDDIFTVSSSTSSTKSKGGGGSHHCPHDDEEIYGYVEIGKSLQVFLLYAALSSLTF